MLSPQLSSSIPPAIPPALGRGKRTKLPTWKRREVTVTDVLPEPAPALPPTPVNPPVTSPHRHSQSDNIPTNPVRRILRSPRNLFGLVRQYFSKKFPEHDPEDLITREDLTEIPAPETSNPEPASYHPYPNKASFELGHWYHNSGQKSREDFTALLDIVADPSFKSSDLKETNWAKINQELGSNSYDGENGWEDEDANWKCSPIAIQVPFTKQAVSPGPKEYIVPEFYHRSLVEVIREKLANPAHDRGFHYEPYELRFDPGSGRPETRVHGELYTSPEFIKAHNDLQSSPKEPGCDLPRVVLGMMFSSDSTQLTSFGNSSIWPLYCYFGNESKYRRCKLKDGLCSHVAYFQKVILRCLDTNYAILIEC